MGMRWWMGMILEWGELILASAVHMLFGFHLISSAVASNLSNALSSILRATPSLRVEVEESESVHGDLPPLVLVHGLFGFGKGRMGGLSYFGGAEEKDERVLVPDLGSLTSIHDRACQLFYYLKGGQVDYGEEHSIAAGHSQFGRVYEQGNYPEWDENHPVHFVAHSAGAQVVRVLQQMLADKAFKGYEDTSENWVLSLTAISGALNGSTRTYLDGMMPEDWRSVKPISMLQLCRIGMILYDWLDIGWMKAYYNFGFDHYNLSWRKIGISGLVDCLMGNIGPIASGDWVLPDLTIQGSMRINSRLNTFQNTFYFSYASKKTRQIMGVTVPSHILKMHPSLWFRCWQMSHWRFPSDAEPPYKGYRNEDWEDNDGALNTISMTHPHLPVEHKSCFVTDEFECHLLKPGIWYYKILEADHMLFVLNRERAGVQFDLMYDGIFKRCRKHVFRKKASTILPNQVHQKFGKSLSFKIRLEGKGSKDEGY